MQAIHEPQLRSQDVCRNSFSSDRFYITFLLPPVATAEGFMGREREFDVLRSTSLGMEQEDARGIHANCTLCRPLSEAFVPTQGEHPSSLQTLSKTA